MTAIDENVATETTDDRVHGSVAVIRSKRGLRRFFRFNLLTLLIALLVVTAYFGVRQRFAVSQGENHAKRELADLSASYTLSPAYPVWMQYALLQFGEDAQHVDSVTFQPYDPNVNDFREAKRLSEKDLAPLARLPRLRKLDLKATLFDDSKLATLRHNRELEELTLSETLVGDGGIEALADHPTLSIVRIDRTLTSDASLKTLARLPDLTEVWLDDSTTAQGIAALAEAPRLTKVHTLFTALRNEDLQPLTKRRAIVLIASAQSSSTDEPTFRFSDYWAETDGRLLTDPEFLARLSVKSGLHVVNVHCDATIDPEDLKSLLALPQTLEIYLDVRGPPIPYAQIEEVSNRVRPANAEACIVYGNVAVTGEDLLAEAGKVHYTRGFPMSPIYAPYVVQDLSAEHLAKLTEAIPRSGVRFQPHAPGHPFDWTTQSSLLNASSPLFEQIPLP